MEHEFSSEVEMAGDLFRQFSFFLDQNTIWVQCTWCIRINILNIGFLKIECSDGNPEGHVFRISTLTLPAGVLAPPMPAH